MGRVVHFLPTQVAWFGPLPFCEDRQFGPILVTTREQIGESNAVEGDPGRKTHFLQTQLDWFASLMVLLQGGKRAHHFSLEKSLG